MEPWTIKVTRKVVSDAVGRAPCDRDYLKRHMSSSVRSTRAVARIRPL